MTSPQGLADRILPARGAAQKASASFAEQLTDSPGRSDIESSPSSNPFRGPASRTKSVKFRYSATGKHLSSPLKGSPSSPERKPAMSRKAKPATFTPAPSSHAAKAKVREVATTSRKRKASASSFRREDILNSIFISSPSPLSSAPTSPAVSTKDLPFSPTPTTNESILAPPKRLCMAKTLSMRSLGPTASKFSVFSQPLSPKRKQKHAETSAQMDLDAAWDIGDAVWILVNQFGVLADSQSHPELSESLMWWPAQIVQKQPLRVSMFGDFPSSSSSSRGLCTIFAPSCSIVQSINDDSGAKRFSRTTFRLTSDDDVSPPTKKQRLDEVASIETKWESAVQSMEKASTLEKDGLPALLSSYATAGGSFYDSLDDSDADVSDIRQTLPKPASSARKKSKPTDSTRKLKPQRSRANLRNDISGNTPRSPSPCLPDPTLQIPGELVLAMAPRTGGAYWPGQILEHVPDRKEKYKVKFLDDEQHVITRDRFWTSEEEGFVRCTLGEWESAVKTIDDPESGDEGGEYNIDDDTNADDTTSALPPPPPAEDFEDLPIRTQLAYVKPILHAILSKEYVPAREKHEAFMRGGSERVALLKSAGIRGGMDARFVKAVQKAICKWVLGDNGVKPERLDTGDIVRGASGAEVEGGVEGGATINDLPPEVVQAETLPRDSPEDIKMVGIDGAILPEDVRADMNDGTGNEALLPSAPDKQVEVTQDCEMVVDGQEQQPPSANGVALSPAVKQASLAAKSQLDLLAEVSQAVATEPSLLPSHPEVPRLKIDPLDVTSKDTSSQPSPLTPVPDEDSRRSALVVCEEFETLSGIEKLDYCLNILLPESIQQLLLWRSGERTSPVLLSTEEEQRLHDVGARKAAETDWVDDVMRLRAAQARLLGIDPNRKAEEKKADVVQSGSRSRLGRGTVSRP
ncbi:hypothetical protein J3R82DRAFT_6106 [Butyriboletus roseoflavus]|nr:hypothetical protein J3R82DRAFT_6106 [Butyriboletus roseoflavus]